MRVDLVLKYLCLVRSRSGAKLLCKDNDILVNDQPVKPSATVRTGDKITIRFPTRTTTLELLDVPGKQLSRSVSPTYYKKISEVDTRDAETDTE
jgi:ribosomal 50S subunit-recycling heat shock protein